MIDGELKDMLLETASLLDKKYVESIECRDGRIVIRLVHKHVITLYPGRPNWLEHVKWALKIEKRRFRKEAFKAQTADGDDL